MPRKALVVDSDFFFVEFLVALLEKRGYQVRKAYDGKQGIAALEEGPYDIIFAELVMPKVNGRQFFEFIRRKFNGPYFPIVALSGTVIEQMDEGGFDLAILDMHMPEMDGVALARQIRERTATLPLVLFSSLGRRETGDGERLFDAYLAKPIRQSHLFDTLVGLLAHEAPKAQAVTGKPLWLGGEDVAGKTVIVYAEQGFGDAIQMARYVPLLAARGAETAIACAPALEQLLASVAGVRAVFSSREPPIAFDCHVPIMSLPRAFRTTLASVPSQVPYLHAPKLAAARWRERLETPRPQRKVGLAWAGNPRHKRDRIRSLPVEAYAPLLAIRECSFFSLQKGDAAGSLAKVDALGGRIVDYTAELESFADTAALVSALDLVITVDTAIAHLAGALGKPVWILLPLAPDSRWMTARADSPWYPSARLFRQRQRGDWEPVIQAVAGELERLS